MKRYKLKQHPIKHQLKKRIIPYDITMLISLLPKGKDKAIRSKDLEVMMQIDEDPGTHNRKIRDIIRTAIIDYNIPIGGCSSGYFIIKTEKELIEIDKRLTSQIEGIRERLSSLKQNFYLY